MGGSESFSPKNHPYEFSNVFYLFRFKIKGLNCDLVHLINNSFLSD